MGCTLTESSAAGGLQITMLAAEPRVGKQSLDLFFQLLFLFQMARILDWETESDPFSTLVRRAHCPSGEKERFIPRVCYNYDDRKRQELRLFPQRVLTRLRTEDGNSVSPPAQRHCPGCLRDFLVFVTMGWVWAREALCVYWFSGRGEGEDLHTVI